MNYKIICEEENLLKFIEWLPDLETDEQFYGCLFARKKYDSTGIVKSDKGQLKLYELRSPKQNRNSNPSYLVQLLWRNEALEMLKERGLHKGFMSKPRAILWNRLIECLPFDELKSEIRKRIKIRRYWRSDQ